MAQRRTKQVEVIDMRDDVVVPDQIIDDGEQFFFEDANGDIQSVPTGERGVEEYSTKERQMIAVALKLSGATYEAIAKAIGVSVSSAYKYCKEAFSELETVDTLKMLRTIHHQRLETLLSVAWPSAIKKDWVAMNTAMGLLDRIDRLHGLSRTEDEDDGSDEDGGVIIIGGSSSTGEYRKALKAARDHHARHAEE